MDTNSADTKTSTFTVSGNNTREGCFGSVSEHIAEETGCPSTRASKDSRFLYELTVKYVLKSGAREIWCDAHSHLLFGHIQA